MKIFCTYCSKHKSNEELGLPALERYLDHRVDDLYGASTLLGYDFYILSGKFGLVHHSDSIPYYNHLLGDSEVEAHSELVQSQIINAGIKAITFFSVEPEIDPNVSNYIACIERAANAAGIDFSCVTLPASYR